MVYGPNFCRDMLAQHRLTISFEALAGPVRSEDRSTAKLGYTQAAGTLQSIDGEAM